MNSVLTKPAASLVTAGNQTAISSEPVVRSILTTKIRAQHRERLAVVYVRQSTPQQVLEHQESGLRQYALASHAVTLGWLEQRVLVIDEDQGQSGRQADHRLGFQRLLSEVTLEHVGLILGLEMSRLARSSKDWHHLLELCALFGTLLGDQDGIYDPTDSNDRLLLGLKGTMSEFELFTMRNRLERGKLHKAQRGELFLALPLGYTRLPTGEVIKDPDEQVRLVTQLIFDKFEELGTAYAVLHYLVRHGIQLGMRPQRGPQRGQLVWRRPALSTLFQVLHHPLYAGAYAYGRHATVRTVAGGTVRTGERCLPRGEWKVLRRDVLPAYITWDQYESNQQRLLQNRSQFDSRGAPRDGNALLPGLLVCGVCGRRLQTTYRHAARPYYACVRHREEAREQVCHGLSAREIDELVVRQVFKALEPAAVELSLKAIEDEQRERERLHQYWNQQCERARQEAGRAERQFQAVEPENRLVGRTLEQRWELALGQSLEAEAARERALETRPRQLTADERQRIVALSEDLPAVWNASSTTNADRKEILRCLVERVVVHVQADSERVDVTIHWPEALTSQHELLRVVQTYQQMTTGDQLRQRITELHAAGHTASQIAATLQQEGYSPPHRKKPYSKEQIWQLLSRFGLTTPREVVELQPHEWKLSTLAQALGVPILRLRDWAHKGWAHARQTPAQGLWIVWADPPEMDRLTQLAAVSKHGVQRYPPEFTTPGPKK